jgi:hypothetical protein
MPLDLEAKHEPVREHVRHHLLLAENMSAFEVRERLVPATPAHVLLGGRDLAVECVPAEALHVPSPSLFAGDGGSLRSGCIGPTSVRESFVSQA